MIRFNKIDDGNALELVLEVAEGFDREELAQQQQKDCMQAWYEETEFECCNGWEQVSPEDIGALTGDPYMVSEEIERDDVGNVTKAGRVFFYPNYALHDPVQELLEGYKVVFESVE